MGFVDFGQVSVAYSNDDLVDSSLTDSTFTGGLNIIDGIRLDEAVFHKAPCTGQIDWFDSRESAFEDGFLFIRETNNFNNVNHDFIVPTEGSVSLADLLPPNCSEDLDGDGAIDFADLLQVLADFGQVTADGDVNGDGAVQLDGLPQLLAALGTACP